MRTLTKDVLLENARKAYDEKRLTAFLPNTEPERCVYRKEVDGKVYGCAIGVSLNDEEIAAIDEANKQDMVAATLNDSIVKFEDLEHAEALQGCHDNWARQGEGYEAYFKEMIGR